MITKLIVLGGWSTDGKVMISVGRHQLAATGFGEGTPTVVIEPSFGGAARDREKIARALAEETTVITYDRAPYGASSPARDARTPRDIAADLDGLLRELGVTGPVVLVGHSAGGLYIRAYAARHLDRVAGMVLVESSHECQRPVLDPLRTPKVPDRLYQAWYDLHSSSHYLNFADPDLVISAIGDVVRCARSGAPLADVLAASKELAQVRLRVIEMPLRSWRWRGVRDPAPRWCAARRPLLSGAGND